MELAALVYSATGDFSANEMYGLTSQMRRAAVSIASNIAEGTARGTRKDFKQFVIIAKGSNCELQTQLLLAKQLGFGKKDRLEQAEQLTNDIGQMLSGLSKYLAARSSARQLET